MASCIAQAFTSRAKNNKIEHHFVYFIDVGYMYVCFTAINTFIRQFHSLQPLFAVILKLFAFNSPFIFYFNPFDDDAALFI